MWKELGSSSFAGADSIEHASFLTDEIVTLAKERDTALVMDIYVTEHILSEGEKNGVLAESLEKERRMVRFGMKPIEAIRAATRDAAELLGLGDQIGQITAGRKADLIAVSGNPLENISLLEKIDFVMKAGVVVRGRDCERNG